MNHLRSLKNSIIRYITILFYSGFEKQCPVCQHSSRKFAPFGVNKRENAMCVWCGAVERHRLIWLFFERKTDLFKGNSKKMLHFAPEPCFIKPLSKILGAGYFSADLYNKAMYKIDMTDIQFSDNTFDVIYCCHVLEHIVNDIKAINELARTLKDNGWALIVVPLKGETTFEDKTITNPVDRLRLFGQEDHVRICGDDYKVRLENNGFTVIEYKTNEIATMEEQKLFGLVDGTVLYYCQKKH